MKRLRVTVEGKTYEVTVEVLEDDDTAPNNPQPLPLAAPPATPPPVSPAGRPAAAPAASSDAGSGVVTSPLAGTVVRVEVEVGQAVTAGAAVLVLEAMKMETPVPAPRAGTVQSIAVEPGASVQEGQTLLTLS